MKKKHSKIYIVRTSEGQFDAHFSRPLFATFDKQKAQDYIEKYNHLLEEYRGHIKRTLLKKEEEMKDFETFYKENDTYLEKEGLLEDQNGASLEVVKIKNDRVTKRF